MAEVDGLKVLAERSRHAERSQADVRGGDIGDGNSKPAPGERLETGVHAASGRPLQAGKGNLPSSWRSDEIESLQAVSRHVEESVVVRAPDISGGLRDLLCRVRNEPGDVGADLGLLEDGLARRHHGIEMGGQGHGRCRPGLSVTPRNAHDGRYRDVALQEVQLRVHPEVAEFGQHLADVSAEFCADAERPWRAALQPGHHEGVALDQFQGGPQSRVVEAAARGKTVGRDLAELLAPASLVVQVRGERRYENRFARVKPRGLGPGDLPQGIEGVIGKPALGVLLRPVEAKRRGIERPAAELFGAGTDQVVFPIDGCRIPLDRFADGPYHCGDLRGALSGADQGIGIVIARQRRSGDHGRRGAQGVRLFR